MLWLNIGNHARISSFIRWRHWRKHSVLSYTTFKLTLISTWNRAKHWVPKMRNSRRKVRCYNITWHALALNYSRCLIWIPILCCAGSIVVPLSTPIKKPLMPLSKQPKGWCVFFHGDLYDIISTTCLAGYWHWELCDDGILGLPSGLFWYGVLISIWELFVTYMSVHVLRWSGVLCAGCVRSWLALQPEVFVV